QVMAEEPVPPSRLQPSTPGDLETICLKCLQKEPPRRYVGAHELAEDLGCFRRDEPIKARPVGRLERAWRWCRRNPAIAGALAVTVTALIVGTAVSIFFWIQASGEATEATRQKLAADMASRQATRTAYNALISQAATELTFGNRPRAVAVLE